MISGRGPARNRSFLYRDHRLSVAPVKHENIARFGRLDKRRHHPPADRQIHERGLRGHVHVPQVVMDGLENPAQFSRCGIQRDDAGRKFFGRRRTITAPLIDGAHPERDVDHAQLVVGGRSAPAVGRGQAVPLSRRKGRGAIRIAGIEVPHQPARFGIECTNHAGRHLRRHVIVDAACEHDEPASDERRRGELVPARLIARILRREIDLTVHSEVGARPAAHRVDGNQPRIVGCDENARAAIRTAWRHRRRARSGSRIPIGHAPAAHMLRALYRDRGIEPPAGLAAHRVDRDHDVVRRA